jgi:chromosome segregation ATPase
MKLLSMSLENFMCYASAEFDFFAITKIMAKNGKGKSSIATAYMWCLFNCDYELKDNPPVRREVNGKTVDDMDTAVTLTLDVDGKEITMRKVQKRTYSKDGSSYKDDNKYFVNDVPKTLKDFNAYLGIDMNAFKMCSNINAFLAKKPAEMREFLFSLTDSVTDLSMAESKDELSELVEQLKKYSAEELSAMHKATKARVAKEIPILDGQIKEKERDIQIKSDTDLSALELARNKIKEQIEKNIKEQTDTEALIAESNTATGDLMDLKFKLSEIQNRANMEIKAQKADLIAKISEKQRMYDDCNRRAVALSYTIKVLESSITGSEKNREKQADLWKQTRNMAFDEEKLVCSYCGQEYPEEMKEKIRADFEKNKAAELDHITKTGTMLKEQIESDKDELKKIKENRKVFLDSESTIFAEIKNLTAEKEALPESVDVSGETEYIAVQNQISEKEKILSKFSSIFEKRAELKEQETELREELSGIERQIFASNTEQEEQRLEELREKRIGLEQSKADSEKILDLLDKLDKVKNEALSESVNSHFSLVKWVLFEYAKNGNYKSVCVPTVDGKSILSTMSNKGNRMLGKLDICSSIQKISGINCSIWLDDGESFDTENQTKAAGMVDSQLIMLIVDNNELRVEG